MYFVGDNIMKIKYFAIVLLLMGIFMLGTVSASNMTDSISDSDNQDFLKQPVPDSTSEKAFDDKVIIQKSDNSSSVKSQSDNSVVKDSSKESDKSDNTKSSIIKTNVKTYDIHSNQYKHSKIFKIKITDKKTKKPIKNLKINFKIENNFNRYKTYILKTNNQGIAKFNIKNLKMGYNSFDITSEDPNYSVYGFSGVSVGKLKKPITINVNSQVTLKNGDCLSSFYVKKFDGMYQKEFMLVVMRIIST